MGLNHSPRIVTNGLVLCLDAANRRSYPGSGTTWTDLSGRGNNLTVGGVGTVTHDGTSFLCTNGYNTRTASSNDSLDLRTQLSMSVWIKPATTLTGTYYYIISKNAGGGYGDHQFAININPSGNLETQLGATTLSVGRTWVANIWYQIISTWDGSMLSQYVNGKVIGSISATVAPIFKPNFSISGRSAWVYPFAGNISNVQIYNRALTAAEIQQNFNALRGRFGI